MYRLFKLINSKKTEFLSQKIRYILAFITIFLSIVNVLLADELNIASISFNGNNKFNSEELLDVLKLRTGDTFSYKKLNSSLDNLLQLYKENGYYFTKIKSPQVSPSQQKSSVEIIINIEEGKRLQISEINFQGNSYFSNEKLSAMITTKRGQIFSPARINNDIATISEAYANKGYPFCEISIDGLNLQQDSLAIFIKIQENDLMRISNIVFEGNKVTRDKTLRLMLNFKENEIYKQDKIKQARRNILRKKYITAASFTPLDSRNLLLTIKEKSMNDFRGVLGLSSDEEESFNERLTGFIDFNFMNIFGTDRAVHLLWEKLKNKSYKIDLSYREPYLLDSQTSATLSLKRKNVDTMFVKTDVKIGLNYYLPNYNEIGISYLLSNSLLDTLSTDRNGVGVHLLYENISHPINPTQGYSISGSYDIVWKNKHSYRHEIFGNLQYIIPVWSQTNFFLQASHHSLFSYNDSLTTYDLFDFGGYENLRGFANNQFRAQRYTVFTGEYRYLLSRDSRLFAFLDYCHSTTYDALAGMGIGFRVKTRLGVLKTDYGLGYQNGKWTNPLEGTIHFGLETGF